MDGDGAGELLPAGFWDGRSTTFLITFRFFLPGGRDGFSPEISGRVSRLRMWACGVRTPVTDCCSIDCNCESVEGDITPAVCKSKRVHI